MNTLVKVTLAEQAHRELRARIVSGKLRRTRTVGGRSVDDNWQFTKSYILRAGKWTVVAFTASPAPQ